MKVKLISFGYHYGIPEGCDVVFDCRSIRNPRNNRQLRKLNGLDKAVRDDVLSSSGADKILARIIVEVNHAKQLGHTRIVLGIGCSFGHHRSVAIAQRMYEFFDTAKSEDGLAKEYCVCEVEHRDLLK